MEQKPTLCGNMFFGTLWKEVKKQTEGWKMTVKLSYVWRSG